MPKQKTQWKDVLNHLEVHNSITSMEAWEKYHITRLADVIWKLRQIKYGGYDIETRDCVGSNEYGQYHYAKYVLHGTKE